MRLAPPCRAHRRRSRRRRRPTSSSERTRSSSSRRRWCRRSRARPRPAGTPRDAMCCATRPGPQAPRAVTAARRLPPRGGGLRRRLEVDPGVVRERRRSVAATLERDDLPQLREQRESAVRVRDASTRQSAASSSSRVTGRRLFAARYTNAADPGGPSSSSSIREPSIRRDEPAAELDPRVRQGFAKDTAKRASTTIAPWQAPDQPHTRPRAHRRARRSASSSGVRLVDDGTSDAVPRRRRRPAAREPVSTTSSSSAPQPARSYDAILAGGAGLRARDSSKARSVRADGRRRRPFRGLVELALGADRVLTY